MQDTATRRNSGSAPSGIAVVVRGEEDLAPLLSRGYRIAKNRGEALHLLGTTRTGTRPDWLVVPDMYDSQMITVDVLDEASLASEIDKWMRAHNPALVGFVFNPEDTSSRYALSRELDAVTMRIKCPVALFHPGGQERQGTDRRLCNVVPFNGDADSRYALETALGINPNSEVILVGTGSEPADSDDRSAREQEFAQLVGSHADNPRVTLKLLLGDDADDQLIRLVSELADGVTIGASRGNLFLRAMLGDRATIGISEVGRRIIDETSVSYAIIREYQGWLGSRFLMTVSRGESLLPSVSQSERIEIYKEIRRAARPRLDFFVMIGLSAAIAAFGLLLNSPAVIIGAMLIAPLMSAIIGMGLGMVQGDMRFLLNSTGAAMRGALVAVAMGALIGALDFTREPTAEMLSRSGPSLLDLAVALLSGAAAAYALCRKDVSASLPGVAIAVALVPPLATIGLFLALAEWSHAYGAFLLFTTNLAAIAFSSGMLFTLVGFRPTRLANQGPERLNAFRRGFLIIGAVVLVVFTHLSIISIDRFITRNLNARVESAVSDYFAEDLQRQARLFNLKIEAGETGIVDVLVTAASSKPLSDEETAKLADEIADVLSRPVRISLITAPLTTELARGDGGK